MAEKIWFAFKFEFESKDMTKALKLHRLLKDYGVVGNVTNLKDVSINKDDRCKAILDALRPGRVYTTGQLWRICGRNGLTSALKTFQRDLNFLVIKGLIQGFRQQQDKTHKGKTTVWSRNILLNNKLGGGGTDGKKK